MEYEKNIYVVNTILIVIAGIGFGTLDYFLELGQFSGLVFYIYFLYFLIGLLLVNLITAIYLKYKKKLHRPYFFSSLGILILILILTSISYL